MVPPTVDLLVSTNIIKGLEKAQLLLRAVDDLKEDPYLIPGSLLHFQGICCGSALLGSEAQALVVDQRAVRS